MNVLPFSGFGQTFKLHIVLVGGFYRVFYKAKESGLVYTADEVPFKKRGIHIDHIMKALNFVGDLNERREPWMHPKQQRPK